MLYYHMVVIVHVVDFWPTFRVMNMSLNILTFMLSHSTPFFLDRFTGYTVCLFNIIRSSVEPNDLIVEPFLTIDAKVIQSTFSGRSVQIVTNPFNSTVNQLTILHLDLMPRGNEFTLAQKFHFPASIVQAILAATVLLFLITLF